MGVTASNDLEAPNVQRSFLRHISTTPESLVNIGSQTPKLYSHKMDPQENFPQVLGDSRITMKLPISFPNKPANFGEDWILDI